MGLPTPIEQSLGLTKDSLANILDVIATLMIEFNLELCTCVKLLQDDFRLLSLNLAACKTVHNLLCYNLSNLLAHYL